MASKFSFISSDNSVVDPDLGGGGGGGKPGFFVACPASFSALCDSFLFLPKVRGGAQAPSLDPPLQSNNVQSHWKNT